MKYHKNKLQGNQDGMVALLIVFVISAIITLVVVGMSSISLRNQQQTQESQLSTQAFYAAETGVQDAIEYLRDRNNSGSSYKDESSYNCDPAISKNLGSISATVGNLSGDGQVEYSCQDIKLELKDLMFIANRDNSTRDVLRAYKTTGGNDTFNTIEIYWHKIGTSTGQDGAVSTFRDSNIGKLPTTTSLTALWSPYTPALMRANLIYVPNSSIYISASNTPQIRTWYMEPMAVNADNRTINWNSTPTTPNKNNDLVPVHCTTSTTDTAFGGYSCKAVISGQAFADTGMVILRLRTMYRDQTSVKVVVKDGSGNIKNLTDSTSGIAQIDVTGRAGTVYRRIRVQADYIGAATTRIAPLPEYSVESETDICKRTQVAMQYSDIFNTSSPKYIQSPISSAVTDPTCGL